ncbi:hypothetical protein V8E53_010654 [Lactarius tabidus]
MAHEGREGPRDDSYNGETYLRSADASQYHPSENEQVQRQPQSTAPPPSQYLGYAPWNAPPSHPGFQEPRYERYAVPCANGTAPGDGAWYETRQNFPPVPPVPAMSATSQYTDLGAGTTGRAPPHHWDSGNPTGAACVYAQPLPSNSQTNGMASQDLTSAANTHYGAGRSAQPHAPSINAPVPSEFLGSLARRVILDLGTRVKAFDVEASEGGRLKVTVTLETADIV